MPKPGFFKFTGLKVRCWFVCRWDCSSGCSQVATCCLLNRNLGTCTSTTNVTDRQRTNKLSMGPFSIHRWGVAGTGRVSYLSQATFRQNLKVVTFCRFDLRPEIVQQQLVTSFSQIWSKVITQDGPSRIDPGKVQTLPSCYDMMFSYICRS